MFVMNPLTSLYYRTTGQFSGRSISFLRFDSNGTVSIELSNHPVSGLKYLITIVLFYLLNDPYDSIFLDVGLGLNNAPMEEMGSLLTLHLKEIESRIKEIQASNPSLSDDERLDSIQLESFHFEEDTLKIQIKVTSVEGKSLSVVI